MIPGSASPFFLGSSLAAATPGGLQISRSLRFNSSDSAYLSRTPAVAGNRRTWTWSGWVKRSKLGVDEAFFEAKPAAGGWFALIFDSSDRINIGHLYGISYVWGTNAVFRDLSAWYHIVAVCDTTSATNTITGTATDRLRLYVNGTQQSLGVFGSPPPASPPAQNADLQVNDTVPHYIGRYSATTSYSNFYLTNIHFIDGQALTPSSFTETDATTGQLIPKTYTGSYGTNGFNLLFADNSSNTASTLGKDVSGLSNNWTPNNLSINTGGPTSVAAASGALPVYNTTDTYGTTKGTGTRTDSNSSSINLALPLDGANNGTTFTDESATIRGSGSARSITRAGDTKTLTASSKFYGSSAYFDGTGDYLRATGLDSIGTGSYTVECWFYLEYISAQRQYIFDTRSSSGSGGAYLIKHEGNGWYWTADSASNNDNSVSLGNIPINSWVHVAIVRSGTSGFLFVNGILTATTAGNTGSLGSTQATLFNSWDNSVPGKGYCQDFRTYSGVAKYTGNFNPPSSTQNATIAAGNDSLVDSPTNYGTDTGVGGEVRGNYCTFNPVGLGGGTLSNGNLDLSTSTPTAAVGTVAMKTGKWYWEITCNTVANPRIGVFNIGASSPTGLGGDANGWCLLNAPSRTFNSSVATSYGTFSPVSGTIVNVAYDADAGKLWFGQDGSYFASGNPATGANASMSSVTGSAIVPAISSGGTDTFSANFGQRAFAYTAPSGFKGLCTQNLPAPLVTKSNTVFDAVLYTGTGAAQSITGLAFSPDLVWIKGRSFVSFHGLIDTVRGRSSVLYSNSTLNEGISGATEDLTSFDANGFSLGTIARFGSNNSGESYVSWTWDAGTSTVSNTQGSITSQVRANATAGFSVMTYTGQTAAGTIGHGLGVAPSLIITKARSNAQSWGVYHKDVGINNYLLLDSTGASTSYSGIWGSSAPTSTVFGVPGNVGLNNNNTWTYVAYAFSPVVGYSSFGSYVGNGSATDGPFVYTGFRPKFVLIKNTSGAYNWLIWDSTRGTYNANAPLLYPNLSNAEDSAGLVDFVSNGFKMRSSDPGLNTNGNVYIYAAFAESPFNYSRAR